MSTRTAKCRSPVIWLFSILLFFGGFNRFGFRLRIAIAELFLTGERELASEHGVEEPTHHVRCANQAASNEVLLLLFKGLVPVGTDGPLDDETLDVIDLGVRPKGETGIKADMGTLAETSILFFSLCSVKISTFPTSRQTK